ncbi:cobalamin biosynthesis protein [Nocardioides sp. 503]|uniref:cobalamin biosynthesis protein n=1 Tax=Nocardioides sp. 503 TaxID=2508326 RepID=UPI00107017EA|nr:cobalamin biosynthesis protein [Nocardioides sp. 503]
MTSLGLVLGYAADAALGDPRRGHPVAGFGRLAAALERRTHADRRAPGVLHVALLVGGAAALGRVAGRGTLATAAATWVVLGGRSLDREAAAVQDLLEAGRLPDARRRLTHLVGRDTAALDEAGVARAVVESLAENSSDAVVAPLVWGALAGTPGLLAYRAANTLDAMVGHRSPRYERFGWAAARLDDLLNLPGSRLTAALTVALGDDPAGAVRAWRRDAGDHPSPNAGPVEAAFAGALGVRLGGRTVYAGRVEDRPVLGDGREVSVHDVTRARRLAQRVDLAALAVCAAISARPRRR